jgi:hypothetical protein
MDFGLLPSTTIVVSIDFSVKRLPRIFSSAYQREGLKHRFQTKDPAYNILSYFEKTKRVHESIDF